MITRFRTWLTSVLCKLAEWVSPEETATQPAVPEEGHRGEIHHDLCETRKVMDAFEYQANIAWDRHYKESRR